MCADHWWLYGHFNIILNRACILLDWYVEIRKFKTLLKFENSHVTVTICNYHSVIARNVSLHTYITPCTVTIYIWSENPKNFPRIKLSPIIQSFRTPSVCHFSCAPCENNVYDCSKDVGDCGVKKIIIIPRYYNCQHKSKFVHTAAFLRYYSGIAHSLLYPLQLFKFWLLEFYEYEGIFIIIISLRNVFKKVTL